MGTREALTEFWPLFGLTLSTPRLRLRPVCDDDIADLVRLAQAGVHDPAVMPFSVPWTDSPAQELPQVMMAHYWESRAAGRPERWALEFAVVDHDEVVGVQELRATDFAVTRHVRTGSWLGRARQSAGIGTEMRTAVLMFAFDHLGATTAGTEAFTDNGASLAVSQRLGYRPDGTAVVQRRPGEPAVSQRMWLTPETFRRPDWELEVTGLAACRPHFGRIDGPSTPAAGAATAGGTQ